MTAVGRVRRTQVALITVTILNALLWAGLAGLGVLAFAGVVDTWVGVPRAFRVVAVPLAIASGGMILIASGVRNRGVWFQRDVALWIERQQPSLAYRLITALDRRASRVVAALDAQIEAVRWARPAMGSMARSTIRPVFGLGTVTIILALLPPAALERVTMPRLGDVLLGPGLSNDRAVLSPIVITVTPPRYSAEPTSVLEEPRSVSALVGSRIAVTGVGDAASLDAELRNVRLAASATDRGWEVSFTLGAEPSTLRLARGPARRLIGFEPLTDSLPVVSLIAPERDTVLRVAVGRLRLEAVARDDYGVHASWFEYIVSAGQGEAYNFRSGVLARRAVEEQTGGGLAHLLSLEALGLAAGDVVHIRAVAEDGNDVTGPGRGVSETRTLRVARPQDNDSISLEMLPPVPADSSLLSQRLLIMLAEALVDRQAAISRDTFTRESRKLGRDQTALRRQVAEVIFVRVSGEEGEHAHDEADVRDLAEMTPEEVVAAAEAATDEGAGEAIDFHGDESPIVAVNRPLLEAYNAMWDAASDLNLGDPVAALPHMYIALEAIQRARAAERIYLRGVPPRIVIDLDRVRLAGDRDAARAGARTARAAVAAAVHGDRLLNLAELLARGDRRAADSLLVFRIEVLGENRALAAALAEASDVLDAGGDVTPALVRARHAVLDPPVHRPLGAWGQVP